jgi:hypothetical protein
MINVSTIGMAPSIKVDGLDLAQLRAICRRVAENSVNKDALSDVAKGFVHLIDGVCEIAQVEVPPHD